MGYCYWWEDDAIRQFVLCEMDFGWMNVLEFNPEGLGSLWLKASATLEALFWLKASMTEGRRAVPLSNYTMAFALQLRKSTGNLRVAE
jgi:hypothetical protein